MHPKLKLAAARHALRWADAEELVAAAHAALDDGFYTYSLGELATQGEPTVESSDRWFRGVVHELALGVSEPDDCVGIILEDAATRIVEGVESPYDVVARLGDDDFDPGQVPAMLPWAEFAVQIREYFDYVRAGSIRSQRGHGDPELDGITQGIFRQAWEWARIRWQSMVRPGWQTSTVVSLAAAIHEEKAFDRLPILADALQEAGCEDADILHHLRYPGRHVTCCWVVEFLLNPDR